MGSFPALPINAEVAPRAILTGWIAGDPLPEGLSLGDECELRDPTDTGAVVKVQRMELSGDEIAKHLESGKQATRLALVLDGRSASSSAKTWWCASSSCWMARWISSNPPNATTWPPNWMHASR